MNLAGFSQVRLHSDLIAPDAELTYDYGKAFRKKAHPRDIVLKKVKVHNLKSVDLTLPTNEFIVFTGVSGSGKSSLAFDTLYVEGQRRYVESLSTFARRQIGDFAKPDLESASGISPTISIEQKTAGRNPRSTIGNG